MRQVQALREKPETAYPEIFDIAVLAAGFEQIAAQHQSDPEARRAALLAFLRQIYQEALEKCRRILDSDGNGTAARGAFPGCRTR